MTHAPEQDDTGGRTPRERRAAAGGDGDAVDVSGPDTPNPDTPGPNTPGADAPGADGPDEGTPDADVPAAGRDEAHLTGGRTAAQSAGTARPEGGGRAAGGEASAPARQWPMLVVTGGFALGLLVTAFGGFRVGALFMGVSMLAGAALRWTLPAVGLLAVRSRFTDVITYSVLAVMIVLLALMVQPDPIVDIPFLEDAIRFAVR